MTIAAFFGLFFLSQFMVYRRAYIRGVNHGMDMGLAIFRSKLNPHVYRAICQKRIAEIDSLLAVKR